MLEFSSLGDLAHHLIGHGLAEVDREVHEGLEKAAQLLETEAKKEFGVYQTGAGPFATWPELAQATKDDRVAKGFTENDPLLRSGDLRDSIEHESSATEAAIGSTDPVMLYQELGTAKIPPRSVLGIALVRRLNDVVTLIGAGAFMGLTGERNVVSIDDQGNVKL